MSQSLRLGEQYVNAVVTKLQANIPARVTQINTDFAADGKNIVLAAPENSDYYTAGVNPLPQAPAIVVAEGRSVFTQEGQHTLVPTTEIVVIVVEEDSDRQDLGVRLQRQVRAVIESLWDGDPQEKLNLPGNYWIKPLRTQPGDVYEMSKSQTWRGLYIVVFTVRHCEE